MVPFVTNATPSLIQLFIVIAWIVKKIRELHFLSMLLFQQMLCKSQGNSQGIKHHLNQIAK